ncbi:major facilitator superfamily multidrug-resistance, DHA1 sub-family [Phlegmacium glaucopus]|nr:major facilitator superfamily multidrug-resistance, DHA1 sub-family [Phlegmacium glaucopus]
MSELVEPIHGENNVAYGTNGDSDVDINAATTTSDKRTPLPKLQLFILFLIQFSEPVAALVIYPFINKFVQETGITQGDERRTGYYAGIIESVFFLAECSTVVQWGYLSDRIGRRPVLLIGPLGLTCAMFFFGSSTTYIPLLISRFFQGMFNGSIGVSQSMIAKMTDASNVGDAYAFVPLMWSVGSTIAPIIGGVLSNPATRWPNTLGRLQFLRVHPYFLPCAVSGSIALMTFIIATLALEETLPSLVAKKKAANLKRESSQCEAAMLDATIESPLINHGERLDYGTTTDQVQSSTSSPSETSTTSPENKPALLNRGLIMIYLNIVSLAFIDMGHFVLLPLFYSTSIQLGGLGLDPYLIGITLGSFGCVNAVVQARLLGPLIRKFGARKMYITCFPGLLVCITLYPIMRHFIHHFGRVNNVIIICMIIQLSFQMLVFASYGSVQVVLARHVSESGRMGTAIGLAQMLAAAMRTIAPALVSSLFSISLERHLAGGNLVFYLLIGLGLLAIRLSHFLPPPIISKSEQDSQQAG